MTSVPEIKIEDLSSTNAAGSIKVAKGFDLDSKLNELAGKYSKLKDWSRAN